MSLDVVICGNIRSEIALYEIVREVLHARNEGLVGRVVFSTWEAEGRRFPDLFGALRGAGVTVVGLEPVAPGTNSIAIQQLQFWRGLQTLEQPADWVFRTRTEKAFPHTVDLFRRLRDGSSLLIRGGPQGGVFDQPPRMFGVSLTEPFAHDDLAFVASPEDWLRLLNFENAFDHVFNDTGYFPQEARWFTTPLMARHPTLKQLFRRVNIHRLSSAMRGAAERRELASAPEAVLRYLAWTWAVTSRNFRLIDDADYGPAPRVEEFIAGRAQRPFAVHWGDRLIATSRRWLEQLTRGDPGADHLLKRIAAVRPGEDHERALRAIDFDALVAFAEAETGPAAQQPRFHVHPATDSVPNDRRQVFEALLRRTALPHLLERGYAAIDEAVERERWTGQVHHEVYEAGLRLEKEARTTGDRATAAFAFMCFLCVAWGRSQPAMDRVCGLALDGLVDAVRREEAFETIYYFWTQDEQDPVVRFWYGVLHLYRPEQHCRTFGHALVRDAAAMGHERAQTLLRAHPRLETTGLS